MNSDKILEDALQKTGIPYAQERYYGKSKRYISWRESAAGDFGFADNEPLMSRIYYQIHYFCPLLEDDSGEVRRLVADRLREAGFHIGSTRKTREGDAARHITIEVHIIV